MKHVFSMTGTLCALIDNKIDFKDLIGAQFYFGCKKIHVLREDKLVPYEATWKNKVKKRASCNNGYSVNIDAVDDEHCSKVLVFIEMIRQADTENRVRWSYSQHEFRCDILDTLPEDDLLIKSGEISTVGDEKNE